MTGTAIIQSVRDHNRAAALASVGLVETIIWSKGFSFDMPPQPWPTKWEHGLKREPLPIRIAKGKAEFFREL